MVLTCPVGFLFLLVWWSSFINTRQQLSSSTTLVTPGKKTVSFSDSAPLLARRGPHGPRGQPAVRRPAAHWGGPAHALLCPLSLACGTIKVRPHWVCRGVVCAACAAFSLEDLEESDSLSRPVSKGQRLPWALGPTACLVPSMSFNHPGAVRGSSTEFVKSH